MVSDGKGRNWLPSLLDGKLTLGSVGKITCPVNKLHGPPPSLEQLLEDVRWQSPILKLPKSEPENEPPTAPGFVALPHMG